MLRPVFLCLLFASVGCGSALHDLGQPDADESADAGVEDARPVDGGLHDAQPSDAAQHDGAVESDGGIADGGPPVTVAGVQHAAFMGCIGKGCHNCFVISPDAGCAWHQEPMNLYGTPDQVVQSLVNVPAISSPNKVRVKPFDPDNSFIVQKLEGRLGPNEGSRMPLGRPQIPQSDIDVLRAWIAQGAQPN